MLAKAGYCTHSCGLCRRRRFRKQGSVLHVSESLHIDSFFIWRNSPQWARVSSFTRFLDRIERRITVGKTPLDECSARRRDLYRKTHNTPNRKTSMLPVGFDPTIPASERPQTNVLGGAVIGTGIGSFREEYSYTQIYIYIYMTVAL